MQGAWRDTISHPLSKCSKRCLSCPERTHVEPTLVGICANIATETPPGGPRPWPTLSYQEPLGSHFTHRPAPEHGCVRASEGQRVRGGPRAVRGCTLVPRALGQGLGLLGTLRATLFHAMWRQAHCSPQNSARYPELHWL